MCKRSVSLSNLDTIWISMFIMPGRSKCDRSWRDRIGINGLSVASSVNNEQHCFDNDQHCFDNQQHCFNNQQCCFVDNQWKFGGSKYPCCFRTYHDSEAISRQFDEKNVRSRLRLRLLHFTSVCILWVDGVGAEICQMIYEEFVIVFKLM